MRVLRALVAVAALCVLASSANAEDGAVGGSEAIKAIVDNTIIVAGLPTGNIVLFVGDDHFIDGYQVRDKDRRGDSWSEKNKKLCLGEEPSCADVTVTGTTGLINWGDRPYQFTIEKGNTVDAHMNDE